MENPQIDIFDENTNCHGCNARTLRIKQLQNQIASMAASYDKLHPAPSFKAVSPEKNGTDGTDGLLNSTTISNNSERVAA